MNYSNIEQICRKYGITNYTLNPDGTVDVDEDVLLARENLTRLPLKFGKVSGNFYCDDNKLTTLEGCPTEVGGGFYCHSNQLTTLEGCPTRVGGDFGCSYNQLTTLEGCPTEVGHFYCNNNPLPQEIIDNPKSFLKQINRDKLINELLEYSTNLQRISDRKIYS